ncbi:MULTISPECIES: hypothetical protein [Janthinobacterium]|uniref:Uncharacterized protein n=1 Tax=Janthinobacterium rivuli TaxID=2751478 RepID=A0ABY8IC89_9BURK|nr:MULTISPECIES: hypothetical protein [Janthinobacterium]MBW3511550.1 hypothetical protein [Janthinobacterium sp. NKUCC06_STL]PHV32397.1 hypothetical protein CSQ94_17880 [Janthinobacterium sp. BJB312]WFR81778.1 hypothetical protein P9875_11735 [Janthinobacterium rivuli]
MPNDVLSVSAHCLDNPACIFTGSDMRIEVVIKNTGSAAVGYPLDYIQQRGPNLRLVDNVSEQSQVLKTGLANHALKRAFTTIAPGQSIALQSIIKHTELLLFRKEFVDVTAEIGVSAGIRIGGGAASDAGEETLPFKGGTSLKIIGRDTLEREAKR